MTETILPLLGSLFFGAIVWLFSRKKKRKTTKAPPENLTVSASRKNIEQDFEEEKKKVEKAVTGKDPAGDLADLGNSRSR
jgi:LPXTG-motif cell wall-anchored protein